MMLICNGKQIRLIYRWLILILSFSASAQLYSFYNFLPGTQNNKQWAWWMHQNWDKMSNSWGDTSTINYLTGGTINQPSEMINNIRVNSKWIPEEKITFEYENGKVSTYMQYSYDSSVAMFESSPNQKGTLVWTGDLLSYMKAEMNITNNIKEILSIKLSSIKIGDNDTINRLLEAVANIENGRIVEENYREKLDMSPELRLLIEEELEECGYPTDTSWTHSGKSMVTYGDNHHIYTNYYDKNNQWAIGSKDSIVMSEGRIFKAIHSELDYSGEGFVNSNKDSLVYDSEGGLMEIVSFIWRDDAWSFSTRISYRYDNYQGASVRYHSNVDSGRPFKAGIQKENHIPVLKIDIANSTVSTIQLIDLQGRSIGNKIKKILSAGTNTVSLNAVPQGYYLCRINTSKNSTVVPFHITR